MRALPGNAGCVCSQDHAVRVSFQDDRLATQGRFLVFTYLHKAEIMKAPP